MHCTLLKALLDTLHLSFASIEQNQKSSERSLLALPHAVQYVPQKPLCLSVSCHCFLVTSNPTDASEYIDLVFYLKLHNVLPMPPKLKILPQTQF
jgi:hypothetical protein